MSVFSKRIVPSSGSRRPEIRLTRVVLPAPFGPIRAWTSPGAEVEVDGVDGGEAAEAAGQAAGFEEGPGRRHRPPGRGWSQARDRG